MSHLGWIILFLWADLAFANPKLPGKDGLAIYFKGEQGRAIFAALVVPEEKVIVPSDGKSKAELQVYKQGKNVLCIKRTLEPERENRSRYFCSMVLNATGEVEEETNNAY